ncbi:glycosyltransferase family 4 protein [Tautonia plasticadhaerens]|uniref:D-inositol 3-phosphate glycosyltransferase n=1 Tax=Tautonia plasticadhaerens TaxID=2527974 RepID=A0A518HC80_9BACT|nr:glycosyltransferase family 1 protein [Tautonia plasticadhaerens]QDV38461.1 D-inositol 3-phosphate glycosyltransferase [Tautonia plasticadhaerens]
MRVGFDGGCLSNRRGFGRFARSLLTALGTVETEHDLVVLIDEPSLETVRIPERFETVAVPVREAPSRAASAEGRRRVPDLLAFGRAAAGAGLDAMVFPSSYSFFPVWNVGRVVVTIFDALPLVYPELVFPSWRGRLFWTLKERLAARSADQILTTSDASRRDLVAHYRLPADRIGLIGAAPDPIFRPTASGPESEAALARYGLGPGERFLLYVGGLSPHKNLPRLISAFARSAPSDVRLAIVGDFGDVFHTHVPELRSEADRLGVTDRIVFTGFVPDPDLVFLYGRSVALVQPSLLEGFGLPPVEAMACGTPVLASSAGSLPEVVGDAGLFFDPTDPEAMAGAVATVLGDPDARRRIADRALERSAAFTWDAVARQLLGHLDVLLPVESPNRPEAA